MTWQHLLGSTRIQRGISGTELWSPVRLPDAEEYLKLNRNASFQQFPKRLHLRMGEPTPRIVEMRERHREALLSAPLRGGERPCLSGKWVWSGHVAFPTFLSYGEQSFWGQ